MNAVYDRTIKMHTGDWYMNEKKTEKKRFRLEHWKKIAFVIGFYDLIMVSAAY